ncbi:kinetochore scaffold 1 isoform X2 [Notolabrus celidotus]|uniref:kinetochore scaffold 1 isoform X2 n=1 Tax=Notolabrus celidotus TaxID=1203425 RepID=UPI0014906E41|nr:kinetochore scaffold 1 isoform X2 [Notolabrus celidotus]
MYGRDKKPHSKHCPRSRTAAKPNLDCFPAFGEQTVRFTANDAAMDMTQSHTVNIAAELELQSLQHTGVLPPRGETTVRFTANDAAMDMTQCLTVNIARNDVLDSAPSDLPGNNTSMKMNEEGDVDVSMDMTEAQTGRIFEMPGTDASPQKKEGMKSQLLHSGGSLGRKSLDTSLTASLRTKPQRQQVKFDSEDDCGEKTLRFTADDAAMDVTRSHTVNIATNFIRQPHQSEDSLPACGEKTMRFTADDAAMDITRSLTVNIAANFKPQSHQMVDGLPACGEKTLRFSANDAAMDETRSHTVNIAANLKPQLQDDLDLLPTCGENTMRFTANDAAMDVTKSHTVNIATNFDPQPHKTADVLASCGEKTPRFSANDAAMDVTQCLTVNIARNSESDSVLSLQESNILSTQDKDDFPLTGKRMETEPCHQRKNRSLTARTLDPGFKNVLPKRSGLFINSGVTNVSCQETVDPNGFQDQPTLETAAFVSVVAEKPVNKTMTEDDVTMDLTEAQTGQILRETCTDEYPQVLTSTQDMNPNSDHFGKTEMTSQTNEAPGSSISKGNTITNRPDSVDSNESDTWKESEPRLQAGSLSKKESSPAAVDHDVDAAPSRKSRRMSLADLHSKMRRLSHLINTAPDTVAMDSCTAPLPESENNMDQSQKERTKTLPVVEAELETGLANLNENTQEQTSTITTTPFNLKTKQLISRLSVGSFKAKLPQRTKPDDQKKMNPVGEHTRTMTLSVTNQLNNFDADVSDINDEELDSYEDMSETIDSRTPQKTNKQLSPSQKFNLEEPLQDDVFEQDFISAVNGKKRPLPVEENNMGENEKRIRASTEMTDGIKMGFQSPVDGDVASECDGTITTASSMTTRNKDCSNISHTGGRCDATSESTFKQSLFESQLEEYASDIQRKFDDGSITVSEFFKLFNIDFVIHNPRQSVNPGRLMSDTDCTPMDVLKDRHIFRPKQMVYESDVLNLTEKVEGLKVRMRDLDKPLRIVNRALWEEMRNASEKELKSFGAKLKERNNFFRKTSKVQSHGTKEILYLQLVQANLEEQQKLRGRIEEADEMIKSLDDCIHELETELAVVEQKGSEDRPSLKSTQEELQKVTETLADNDRQLSELEMQKTQNSNKLTRLKTETKNLESRVTALNMLNEWRLGEKRDNCTVYTFLYETFHLLLEFDKSNENAAENQSERKISNITFKLQLDDEKSQDHARLVQKLLSEYIKGETSWVERYPTSRHVPTLLHDVGLVVSRCRLLGEELRLLKMWGGLKLNILNISCVDTQVHIVFSSLKTLSKFEVILSVRLTNQLCVLEVQSFRNMIGGTTIEQIEEIVASFSPAKNLLTRIVKKIHESLLC